VVNVTATKLASASEHGSINRDIRIPPVKNAKMVACSRHGCDASRVERGTSGTSERISARRC
jgi:hypothetical protein